jgi:hypothetical protein
VNVLHGAAAFIAESEGTAPARHTPTRQQVEVFGTISRRLRLGFDEKFSEFRMLD